MSWPLLGISYRNRESVSVVTIFYNLFVENVITTYYKTELLCSGKSSAKLGFGKRSSYKILWLSLQVLLDICYLHFPCLIMKEVSHSIVYVK
jgi:hypothetical protein